ncbi:MAG TPA: ABC transporter ATP-binding protein [Stellaceae bacterium]|nr:ABC transporter ATP-binding protein [Stellaceae bacterium]
MSAGRAGAARATSERRLHRLVDTLFRSFERLISATGDIVPVEPPGGLLQFYWHFVRQAKGLFAGLLAIGLVVALLDATIPVFIGKIVNLVATKDNADTRQTLWPILIGMATVILVLRPVAICTRSLVANQSLAAGFSNLVRWQSHWHVVRQSWAFFQNDFAGRIATKVMQTGPALRESVVSAGDACWYIIVYGTSALLLLAHADLWLALPVLIWFVAYVLMLRYFVPRLRDRSRIMSESRSVMTGRIVDSYTNILTVKLFARSLEEDRYVREAIDVHTDRFREQLRLITQMILSLSIMNSSLIVATAGPAIILAFNGTVPVGTVAMVLPLAWQLVNISGWVAFQVTSIFENVGVVQEGMGTIARPLQLTDRPGAQALTVPRGEIRFEGVRFGYGTAAGVIDGLDLAIRPGEKIGLVGRSGAGKSTIVNLLLRFFDLEAGRILIDGQDISGLTQDSLRSKISVVTQDTSLLHRSIRDNILYGRPDASEAEVVEAAKRAEAHDFIQDLEDLYGRRGYDAHVGERGVKLSGGQRQRIAIARVILKNAPILVLDEATSALDSEVEAAIQASLEILMVEKTVVAVAHRLSTIARMDRLVILDRGRVVEQGTHAELLDLDGHYARLWKRQSGGFLDDKPVATRTTRTG